MKLKQFRRVATYYDKLASSFITKRYKIYFFDKKQILTIGKQNKVQTMIDVFKQHFQHPFEKSLPDFNKNNGMKRNNNKQLEIVWMEP